MRKPPFCQALAVRCNVREEESIRAMVRQALEASHVADVRDWATFGLASMTGIDTPEIRAALMSRTAEEDAEIRGEALVGLARRKDPRVLDLVKLELQRPFEGNWAVEAAEELADASLLPFLQQGLDVLDADVPERFVDDFMSAMEACRPKDE